MTREQMMDNIIKKYGFEDARAVWFCNLCEDKTTTDYTVENAYIVLETMKNYWKKVLTNNKKYVIIKTQ